MDLVRFSTANLFHVRIGHAAQPTNGAAAAAAAQPAQGGATQDYSAEWANYYRSLGKIEEAEAIEKQMAAAKVSENAS
jgi:far upstream element-binding protein